jgi:hypothetical protein
MITENFPLNEKVTLFLEYYFQQLTENQNVPIEVWNLHKHRKKNSKTVEGCNSKLNSIIGKQEPYVFLQVQKVKKERIWYFGNRNERNLEFSVKNEERLV